MTRFRSELLIVLACVIAGAALWWLITNRLTTAENAARAPSASQVPGEARVPEPAAPQSPDLSHVTAEPAAPPPASTNAENIETPANLRARLNAERRDTVWAPDAEAMLRGAFRSMNIEGPGTTVQIVCRTTLCEVRVASVTQQISHDYLLEYLRAQEWFGEHFAHKLSASESNVDRTTISVIFLQREDPL